MRRDLAGRALIFLALVLSAGCGAARFLNVHGYSVRPASPSPHLLAGAASVDITPPPGYPMGGHSLAGRFSRGHWMRLRARAFYFRDKEGGSLALVSCDLYAIPAGLQQMVAARLHPKQGQPGPSVPDISRDNLILTATHTHQSPGNFMSNRFYNDFGSPYPGFSKALFEDLANKIAGTIACAVENAEKHPEGAELILTTTKVPELFRNRAIRAFSKNDRKSVQDPILANNPTRPVPIDCMKESSKQEHSDLCLRYGAFDPELTVLVVRRPDGEATGRPNGKVAALLVFGAVHPTVLSHEASFYSPDLAGVAMRDLEQRQVTWTREPGMVAGFFNGAEGDVSPRWVRRDVEEAEELGSLLAASVSKAVGSGAGDVEGPEAHIRAARQAIRQYDFCGTYPTPGVGTLGGAEDGRFVSFDLGWRAPYRRAPAKEPGLGTRLLRWWRAHGQGKKQPAFELSAFPLIDLTQVLAPPENFPSEVPVTIARLGSLAFLAVPAEMTTAMGQEVRGKLTRVLGSERTIILGLANEYLEYVTTPAEYEVQEYEGGSTLFGPKTGQCYIDLFQRAAKGLDSREGRPYRVPSARFEPGPPPLMKVEFGVGFWGSNQEYLDQELRTSFATASRLKPDFWPRFEWKEEKRDDARVRLLEKRGRGWDVEEDDDGLHPALATFLADGTKDKRTWDAYWFPKFDHDNGVPHVFVVKLRDGTSVCSDPFTIDEIKTGQKHLPLRQSFAPCPP